MHSPVQSWYFSAEIGVVLRAALHGDTGLATLLMSTHHYDARTVAISALKSRWHCRLFERSNEHVSAIDAPHNVKTLATFNRGHGLISQPKTLQQAAELIRQADGLVVTAGSGIGLDSGLPDLVARKGSGTLIKLSDVGSWTFMPLPVPTHCASSHKGHGNFMTIASNFTARPS